MRSVFDNLTNLSSRLNSSGLFFAFLASIFSYLSLLFVKLAEQQNIFITIFVRSLMVFYISFYVIHRQKSQSIPNKRLVLILLFRGLLVTVITFFLFISVNYIPTQISVSVYSTYGSFTYIIAVLNKREQFTKSRLFCIIGVSVGIFLILNPDIFNTSVSTADLDPHYVWSVLGILIAAIIKGYLNNLLKSITETDPMVNNLFFGGISLFVGGSGLVAFGYSLNLSVICFLIFTLAGLASFLYQTCSFKAIKLEHVSTVSIIESLSVFYSYFVDMYMLNIKQKTVSTLGCFLTAGCLVILSFLMKNE